MVGTNRELPGLLAMALLAAGALSVQGQTAPAEGSSPQGVRIFDGGARPAAAAKSPETSTAKAPEASPSPSTLVEQNFQVYFMKPKAQEVRHLYEIAKLLESMGLARPARVDAFSRTLVVATHPSLYPQVAKMVETLEPEDRRETATASLRQVSLDVKVILASQSEAPSTSGVLSAATLERLRSVFGYKSFALLGTQLTMIKIGEQAQTETHFKDPSKDRDFPFQLSFNIEPDMSDLRIKASIKALGQQAAIATTFLAKPDQSVLLGNSTLKSGEALIYLLTPRAGTEK